MRITKWRCRQIITNCEYAIFPVKKQTDKLESAISICRIQYNSAILDKSNHYKNHKKGYNRTKLQEQLTRDKKVHPVLESVHSQPLQEVFFRVERSFKNFFDKRARYPKIKSARQYNSLTYTQFGLKVNLTTGAVKKMGAHFTDKGDLALSKIGNIKIFLHRPIDGIIKQAHIKRKGDRWFAIFSVEGHVNPAIPSQNNAVGIDVGINKFAVLSNEEEIKNPRFLRKKERSLKRTQRKLSKMKRGSQNWKKQINKLQKLHTKVSNQRKDFLHKQSYHLTNTYDVICVEDLNIRNMVRNKRLSKSISDAGWGMFRNMLKYKSQKYGATFIAVEPRYTSQDCSGCGTRVKKALSTRTHICTKCGTILDRDHNAALNIKKAGLSKLEDVA